MFGYGDFTDPQAAAGLREFLDGRAWVHAEGPYALFEEAVAWLRRHRVLLPGVNILARLVATVREAAAERMHRTLAEERRAACQRRQAAVRDPSADHQRRSRPALLRAAPGASPG